jgi:hypothetical protein
MKETAPKRQLTRINYEIEDRQTELARLERERGTVVCDVRRAKWRVYYLRLAAWLRKPAAKIELWPMAVMLIGPLFVGMLVLGLGQLLTDSYPVAFLAFLFGIVAGVGLFASLIYMPADANLATAIVEAESQLQFQQSRLNEKAERIAESKDRLQKLLTQQREQIASGKLQKAALLQRNWKGMRDEEWADFVVEVFRTLGAQVERIGPISDEDASLIADFPGRKIAVLVGGEGHHIDSSTIRNALAVRESRRCDSCAVIVNRRFTGAAQNFARANGCAAIGASEFPDFVLGNLDI